MAQRAIQGADAPHAPIIIMGMHRSGTTLLMQLLEALGVFAGRAGGSNREAGLFKHVNKWMFSQIGATAVNPDPVPFLSMPRLVTHFDRVLQRRIRGLGAAHYLGAKHALRLRDLRQIDFPWAWKDPRNSYTAGLWKRVFPEAKILHIYRHPLDVAYSLKKREEARLDNFRPSLRSKLSEAMLLRDPLYCRSARLLDPLEGVDLWAKYVEASFATCARFEQDAYHCRYETLLERPARTLGQIASFIGLEVDAREIERAAEQVNPTRGLAHKCDPTSLSLAAEIAEMPLVQKLGYRDKVSAMRVVETVSSRAEVFSGRSPTAKAV